MARESLFAEIPQQERRSALSRLALEGLTVSSWARREGFNAKTVNHVLSGRRKALRGTSLRIAIKLGLRPDPTHPVAQPGLPDQQAPAGRTEEPSDQATPGSSIAGGRPIPDRNRPPISQAAVLGEAVR